MHQLGFCRYNLLITSVGWAILSESSVSFAHSTCLKHNWCTASPKSTSDHKSRSVLSAKKSELRWSDVAGNSFRGTYLPKRNCLSKSWLAQVEKNILNGKLKALTLYFGDLISQHCKLMPLKVSDSR